MRTCVKGMVEAAISLGVVRGGGGVRKVRGELRGGRGEAGSLSRQAW